MVGSYRLRRFRTPIIFSILIVLGIYHFTNLRVSDPPLSSVDGLKTYVPPTQAPLPPAAQPKPVAADLPIAPPKPAIQKPSEPEPVPVIPPVQLPHNHAAEDLQTGKLPEKPERPKPTPGKSVGVQEALDYLFHGSGSETPAVKTNDDHWTPEPIHYPLPAASVIPLPTSSPKLLPRVQAKFEEESQINKQERLRRLKSVKAAFVKDWTAYKKEAWGHDEVKPVSGGARNTFGGWGATLVDGLDTLWIMGLKDEFEEAVAQVAKIDFTTTPLMQIPVFETTIRYLGGLLGAYDVSGGQYPVLLKKAEEIGKVLYGAFDTPNRMPRMYYKWKPSMRRKPGKAEHNVVVSEVGSLFMEFTRLAQITGNSTYYDAVARIADALEDYQKRTLYPGLFPTYINTAGCKSDKKHTSPAKSAERVPAVESASAIRQKPVHSSALAAAAPVSTTLSKRGGAESADDEPEEANTAVPQKERPAAFSSLATDREEPCEAYIESNKGFTAGTFTMGALADSLYEYLIKQYLLMGGTPEADRYKRMYTLAADAVKEHLLFRPRVPNDLDILFTGDLKAKNNEAELVPVASHLGCFTGGMFGLGAATLGRDDEMSIAKKLTAGCVWAYDSTQTGVMPELLKLNMCPDPNDCVYTERSWLQSLVPKRPFDTPPPKPSAAAPDSADAPTRTNSPAADPPSRTLSAHAKRATHAEETPEQAARRLAASRHIPPGFREILDAKYIMRPEAIESVWYMYRITGDAEWQDRGWRMWEAVNAATDSALAHSAIADVSITRDRWTEATWFRDELESFWFGETLKYYYLLFSEPDVVSLDEYVLNTEAHPFLRPKPKPEVAPDGSRITP